MEGYNRWPMPLAAHGVTHPGRRSTNEDALLVEPDRGLFVVADGMGGHNAGEVASSLAVKAIGEFLSDGTPPSLNLLDEALRLANDHILAAAAREPGYSGMGTTVVVAFLTDRDAVYAHVGDSRIYLWRNGQLMLLTQDDSWVAAALNGSGEEREYDSHPMRHVLTKVVGLRPELQPSVGETGFGSGDVLLLCSDGVHGSLPFESLSALLGSRKPVDKIAESIVHDAMARGATDNVTAVVVRRD
jgi:protein phosphatase